MKNPHKKKFYEENQKKSTRESKRKNLEAPI
jgi:hypothetical protein